MGLLAGAGGVGVAGRVILLGDVVVVLTMTPLWFYLSLDVDPRQHPFVHPDVRAERLSDDCTAHTLRLSPSGYRCLI